PSQIISVLPYVGRVYSNSYYVISSITLALLPTSTLFPYTTLFRSRRQSWRPSSSPPARPRPPRRRSTITPRSSIRRACSRRPSVDRKSTRLNSSHEWSSYAVFCLKKKNYGEDQAAAIEAATAQGLRRLRVAREGLDHVAEPVAKRSTERGRALATCASRLSHRARG